MARINEVNARLEEVGLHAIDAQSFQQIQTFLDYRSHWNQTHNLAGPKALGNPWVLDVQDAVALQSILETTDLPLYDVGSGSGVPGLLLKLLMPTLTVHLVEPLAKRVAFLKTVIHRLGLKAIEVHRTKWPLALEGPCQVVSRAVVSPRDWPKMATSVPNVSIVYRYLAAERPDFSVNPFTLTKRTHYLRAADEQMVVERWNRATPFIDDAL